MAHEVNFKAEELRSILTAIRQDIALRSLKLSDEYFYASLPLCVIDAVFSIGVTYASTRQTVVRWCQHRGWTRLRRDGGPEHSISDLIEILDSSSPEALASDVFGNRQRTSSRSGILKAEAVHRWAKVLHKFGVERLGDTFDPARNAEVEKEIRNIPGQGSGISFEYFLMLAGSDEFVKADRMICRYIGNALQETAAITPDRARELLVRAAHELAREVPSVTPRALDHAIWELQRNLP